MEWENVPDTHSLTITHRHVEYHNVFRWLPHLFSLVLSLLPHLALFNARDDVCRVIKLILIISKACDIKCDIVSQTALGLHFFCFPNVPAIKW